MAHEISEKPIGALPFTYQVIEGDSVRQVEGGVIDEGLLSIYVNGESLATMMCSPVQLEALTVGFLYNEAVIDGSDEIGLLQLNQTKSVADVILTRDEVALPRRMILTTGLRRRHHLARTLARVSGAGIRFRHVSRGHLAFDAAVARRGAAIQCRARRAYGGTRRRSGLAGQRRRRRPTQRCGQGGGSSAA